MNVVKPMPGTVYDNAFLKPPPIDGLSESSIMVLFYSEPHKRVLHGQFSWGKNEWHANVGDRGFCVVDAEVPWWTFAPGEEWLGQHRGYMVDSRVRVEEFVPASNPERP
jgi:hypothetical protein